MSVVDEGQVAPSRVERKRRARKRQILDAALRLCARDGLEGMTVQKLADELDYTAGALYRYFPSKEALVAELEARAIDDIAAHFRAAREQWDELDAVAGAEARVAALFRLLAAGHFYVDLLDTLPEQLRLIGTMLGDPRIIVSGDELARVVPGFVDLIGEVSRLIDDAVSAGAVEPGDSRARTVVVWSSLQGIVQMNKMTRFHAELFEPRRRGPELTRALLLGWGADPKALADAGALIDEWRKQCSQRLQ